MSTNGMTIAEYKKPGKPRSSVSRIRRKLSSERGASLSFALMLLLLGTVVGVILLQSATAAAGRVSRLAAADARYYSVNSAADMIVDTIAQAGTQTVVQTYRQTCTVITELNENKFNFIFPVQGTPVYSDPDITAAYNGENVTRGKAMVMDWVLDKVFGAGSTVFNDENAWNRGLGSPVKSGPLTENHIHVYELNLSAPEDSGMNTANLQVRMQVTVSEEGGLEIELSNVDEQKKDIYRVRLVYAADVKEQRTSYESAPVKTIVTSDTVPEGYISQKIETTVTTTNKTKTTTLSWSLIDRKELSSAYEQYESN